MNRGRPIEHRPFSPARCPFFYGWFVLAAGTLGVIISAPGQTIGVAAFIEPLIEELGISRSAISLAYGIGTLASAMMLTFAGRLYDRLGARWSGALASLGMGLTLIGLGRMDWMAATLGRRAPGLSPAGAAFIIAIPCFFLLRFLGQGMLTLISRNMVMKWFVHRRGLANGLMGVFIGLAFSASPPLFNSLIASLTWQGAWTTLGWIAAAGFTVFVLIFYRDNPEACGLLPEGGRPARSGDPPHEPRVDFTLKGAIRTRVFWIFSLALSMQALYGTAFAFHVESILGRAGFDSAAAYRVFLPAAAIAVTLGFAAGWASDHVPLNRLLAIHLIGLALSILGLLLSSGWTTFAMAVIGNGMASAMFGVLLGVTWPRYFGRRHLGEISGFQLMFNVIFSAIGPALFAFSLRFAGDYRPALGLCLAAVALLLTQTGKAVRPV